VYTFVKDFSSEVKLPLSDGVFLIPNKLSEF